MPITYNELAGKLPQRRSSLRVILADDHTILRRGLRAILDAQPDLQVVGEATNVHDAIALARCLQPDVIISDVSFGNGCGIQTIKELQRECAGVRVVMLSGHASEEYEVAAMQAGAHAYILKESPIEVLLEAVFSPSAESACSARALPSDTSRAGLTIAQMTARERQVLIGVAMGYSSKRIAGQLGRSVKTIEKHRFKMMHKLGLKNAAAVTRYAMNNGLLDVQTETQDPPAHYRFPPN